MSMCCVSSCANRPCRKSKIRFHRIPSGNLPSQANRRKLWLHAIQQANNSSERLSGSARVCGAHFISGEMSLDHDNVDFIPSVFPCIKRIPEENVTGFMPKKGGRPKKVYREEEMKTPEDEQSPILMEEFEAPYTRSAAKEAKTLIEMAVAEKEASTITSQTTSSPNKTSPLVPEVRNPLVVLQPLILQAGGFQFQLCSQNLTTVSQPVEDEQPDEDEDEDEEEEEDEIEEKFCSCGICGVQFTNHTGFTQHRCIKPEEPSFPCNMCDRSLNSYHCLKRHKLLHVKDGRKCGKCGVLFCRRHNHTPFRPATDFKEASSSDQVQTVESKVKPENGGQQKSDLSWTPGAMTVKPRRRIVTIVPKPPPTINTVPTPPPTTITTVPTPSHSTTTVLTAPITATTTVPTPSHSTTTGLTAPITATTTVPTPSHSTTTVPTAPIIITTVPTPSHSTATVPTAPIITTTTTTTVLPPPKPQPLSKTHKFKPTAPGKRVRVRVKTSPAPSSASSPPPPVPGCSSNPDAAARPPQLPSSLRMFSPQYLTSALLQVTRNHEYILSKSKGDVKVIKEEPSERSISPVEEIIEQIVEAVPIRRIAYDLEIVV